MTKPAAMLGIDLGTTAVKLGLFAVEDGRQLALSTREYPLDTPHERWAELDAEIYWSSIVAGVNDLRLQAPDWRIASIGLSSQAQTFVVLDRDNRPIRPAIVWLDTRASAQCERLCATFSEDDFRRFTGLPYPQQIMVAPKLLWLAEHEPDTWQRIHHVAMLPSFIAHRLTGHYACDPCNLKTSLFYGEAGWWDELLQYAQAPRDWFDDVAPTGTCLGVTTPEAARTLGIAAGIPVGAGSNDQLTGAIGVGNVRPGIMSGAIGTAMAIVGSLRGDQHDPQAAIASHDHAILGLRYALTFSMTTGILLRWYRDKFAPGSSYEELIALALEIPPGAEGLTALPHFSGVATPTFDATVKGGFVGLTMAHGPGHLIRALLEAVAFTVRDSVELLRIHYPGDWQVLRVLGGATRSLPWLQMIADTAQLQIERPTCTEAAVFGAALVGGVAANLLPDLAEAGERFYHADTVIQPGSPAYEDAYQRYRDAMQALYPDALGLDRRKGQE